MRRRSRTRAAAAATPTTTPTTSRRCHSSMGTEFDGEGCVPMIRSLVGSHPVERATERWRLAAWLGLVAFLILLGYGSRLAGGTPPRDALYRYDTAIGSVVVYLVLLAVLLWIGRGLPRKTFFALRAPASWLGALGWSLAAYVAIFLGAGLLLIVLDAGDEQGLTPEAWESSKAGAYAANFVAIALVGPAAAVAATAVLFGLGHGLLLALAALVLFGLVTAMLRLKTDSIYPCMLVHCAFNATSRIVAVAA